MRILIDTVHQQSGLTLNEIFFLDKCIQLLVNDHPEHEWLFDAEVETKGIISLLPVGIKKSIQLKKIKPDVIITIAELNSKYPGRNKQIVFYNQEHQANKRSLDAIKNCRCIVTNSEKLKQKLVSSSQMNASQVVVIPAAPSGDIAVADWSEKLSVKDRYSDGRDFFLCFKRIGRNTQWEEVLKAFSIFKKWQQSSFQLIIACEIEPAFKDEFDQRLASYKYRADVKILDTAREDIDRILPSAFGVVCADKDCTGLTILNAFKVEVPVISSAVDGFDEEISGAFLPSIMLADELSRQLINLYRDERMKEIIVEKGKEMLSRFSWEGSEAKWYDCIMRVAEGEFN